jgi:hypothetical protein
MFTLFLPAVRSCEIKKIPILLGHVPQKIALLFFPFCEAGCLITAQVTNSRQHSTDLPQEGLELPYI